MGRYVQWCRRHGCSASPKLLFVKNPGKIPENLGKLFENLGKMLDNLSKIFENPGKIP